MAYGCTHLFFDIISLSRVRSKARVCLWCWAEHAQTALCAPQKICDHMSRAVWPVIQKLSNELLAVDMVWALSRCRCGKTA